jgi:hypothetical protein
MPFGKEEKLIMGANLSIATPPERRFAESRDQLHDEHSSGVSWAAVIGGAFVAAAVSLIMLALGAGFGLSAVSPWSNVGASAIGAAAIVWLIVNEAISCALGGYLAGRLRTKWVSVHTDEVYFRDTANGFLVWAVAVVMTVTFLASAASFMVGKDPAKSPADSGSYFVDRLFRGAEPVDASIQAEASRILLRKDFSADDQAYLAKLVAAKAGLTPDQADQRVAQVITEIRQTEDSARQTASHLVLWTFLALLIGAFCASYAATIGGRQRDHVKAI